MKKFVPKIIRGCFVLVLSIAPQAADEILYTALPLGNEHYPADLNNHGEIVGEYRDMTQGGIYFDGQSWEPRGARDDFAWSSLYGINDQGFAVGLSVVPPWISEKFAIHAVRVERGATNLFNLGSLTGPDGNASARAINNLNIAVGDSLDANGIRRAVRFETNGTVTDLGSLGGTSSSAIEINDRGEIAGTIQNPAGQTRGFFLGLNGIMQDIGTLGGGETFPRRMNAEGEIVGSSMTASGAMHAFHFKDGVMQDLGTLGGTTSVAYGINDQGVIVGMAEDQSGTPAPFIKYPGQALKHLGTLAQAPSPDVLISAETINNHGWITARGRMNSSNYLLRPGALTLEVRDETVVLKFAAPEGLTVQLESSDSLTSWTPMQSQVTGTEPIVHELPKPVGAAFYRALLNSNSD